MAFSIMPGNYLAAKLVHHLGEAFMTHEHLSEAPRNLIIEACLRRENLPVALFLRLVLDLRDCDSHAP